MEFLSCIYECQNRGWKTSTGVKWGRQGFPKRVAVLFLPHVTLDRFQRRRQQCNFWRKKKTHAKLQNWGQQYNIYGAKIQKWTKSYLLVMFQSDFQALKMIQKFSPLVTRGLKWHKITSIISVPVCGFDLSDKRYYWCLMQSDVFSQNWTLLPSSVSCSSVRFAH